MGFFFFRFFFSEWLPADLSASRELSAVASMHIANKKNK